MKVYAVFRGQRNSWGDWHIYKLFANKKDADAFVASRNPNRCIYRYDVQQMKVY